MLPVLHHSLGGATVEPRHSLGKALFSVVEKAISVKSMKPMAKLITRNLCGSKTAKDLGFERGLLKLPSMFLAQAMRSAKMTEVFFQRLFVSDASMIRMLVRVVGYHLLLKVFTDNSQPLDLTKTQQAQIHKMLATWSHEARAPKWMNKLEDSMTTHGSWKKSLGFKISG